MSANSAHRDRDLLGICTGFLLLFVFFQAKWLLYVAVTVGVAGVFFPFLAKGIHIGWTRLTFAIGWVNSRIILSVLFFLILTPIAWIYRLGKKDSRFRWKKQKTYFQIREHKFDKEDLEKTW